MTNTKKESTFAEIEMNGVAYIRKDLVPKQNNLAKSTKGLRYVLVRTYSAGVHVGFLSKQLGKEVKLINTRRIWYWDGAASLSQLALEGVSKPDKCKFSVEIPEIELTEVIEIISVTKEAQININNVPAWKL